MSKKNCQQLSPQELSAIENYLAKAYLGPVDFSRHVVATGALEDLRESISLKSGDVFTLQGNHIYHQVKFATAVPLKPVVNSDGLYIVKEMVDGSIVHLDLLRVTDVASASVAA